MRSKFSIFDRWLWQMAWRDSRKTRGRLILFTSSIILGIAALVAINSFRQNLNRDINRQAKEILGADLVLSNTRPVDDSVQLFLDSIGGTVVHERSFASMVFFPKTSETRLVQVRALGGDFPFYGNLETTPENASRHFRENRNALVDNGLLLQFDSKPGDSIKVGNQTFYIEASLEKAPGQNGIAAIAAAPVYIPLRYLESTGLEQKGSRIRYRYYLKLADDTDVEALAEEVKPRLRKDGWQVSTVESTKRGLGNAFENLTKFLNLVAFVALLLGCVGVASAVHIYVKEKLGTVAILRCLGLKGAQAFIIYLIQIVVMGFLGSLIGSLIGTLVQTALPEVLKDFLPIEITFGISWIAILEGIGTGLFISILFALSPLLTIRKVSPLYTLRASFEKHEAKRDLLRWFIYLLIVLFIYGFSYLQMGKWLDALFFCLALGISFLLLLGVGRLIMWLVRKYFPVSWNFVWRQSLANLYRPHNQTLILIVSVGLGTALITTLYFVQSLLLQQVSLSSVGNQPNMVVFDIQSAQKDEIGNLTKTFGLPVIQEVPVVTMRLMEINGKAREEIEKDSTNQTPRWAFNREYRVTYREQLIDSEKSIEGEWKGKVEEGVEVVPISLDEGYAEGMKVEIGDTLTFNVQGAIIKTKVGHLRDIEWNRVQTNFLVLFPTGVLESAPQFHVLMTRVSDPTASAKFQRTLVQSFPNVSIIDLGLILSTIDEILDKVSFVIRFMALFSIVTGFFVLFSSVVLSKFQRIQESVLLRTIGANRKHIVFITSLEYFFLGSLGAATGIILSLLSSWALAYFSFESTFVPNPLPMVVVYVVITTLTVLIGVLNSREVLNKPPLEVLRKEV
ncbi:FtsX-like permease family protein [Fulvivirgaceae bacterium BMA10]|uniref:FtsX-like permease family protein n=1 Tax=Splendidivirga corallicola TaxID=3051826 RepID=A0ABT8KI61_9BACT|nr:FtsX-like permease family protein [Fulvivirgaceae bacterium BMA10]